MKKMKGCNGKCENISGAVNCNSGRVIYELGSTGIQCRICEIILPIDHHLIRVDRLGGKHCPCCNHKLSRRIRNNKTCRTRLEVAGLIKRY